MRAIWLYISILCIYTLCITSCNEASISSTHDIRIAFYNTENTFDTIDDTLTDDDDFTLLGKNLWNDVKYLQKIENISNVISSINASIIGLCEVENDDVLHDLTVKSSDKTSKNYRCITIDSGDERGLDPAIIYDNEVLLYISHDSIKASYSSRSMMEAAFKIRGIEDTLRVLVCHWTSRYMGRKATEKSRLSQGKRAARWVKSIPSHHQVVVMGDFNDEIGDVSLRYFSMLVPHMNSHHTENNHSYYYQGRWYAFDQIFTNFVPNAVPYRVYKDDRILNEGKYPYRTYTSDRYIGGYSDHLPVYIDYKR